MKTKAVRLYGEMDLRLDEFELPEMQDPKDANGKKELTFLETR